MSRRKRDLGPGTYGRWSAAARRPGGGRLASTAPLWPVSADEDAPWTSWTLPDGSSASRPSTTSSSSRSPSALVWLVAGMQTAWVRTGNEKWLRATKFFGKIFLINFAIGRGHRHRAGVPVRDELERLLPLRRRHLRRPAGDRGPAGLLPRVDVPRPVDLRLGPPAQEGCTWPRSGWPRWARMLSAYFILAANSWMQHPVGYEINPVTGRAELTDFAAVLDQNTRRASPSSTRCPRRSWSPGSLRRRHLDLAAGARTAARTSPGPPLKLGA